MFNISFEREERRESDMVSIEDLRNEIFGFVPKDVVSKALGKDVTSLFVGENLAYALETVSEEVVNTQFCKIWVTNYEGELLDSLLDYTLETTDLQDFNIQVCKVGTRFEVYNRKNGRMLFRVNSNKCTDLVEAFRQYFKDFKGWEDVSLHLEKGISCTLTDGYLIHANAHKFTEFDDEILSIFDEDLEEYDYDDLYTNHVYCGCPEMLLNCEEFKAVEEVERVNQDKLYADYVTTFLGGDYLAELLKNAGEFVVCLDDCNVWLFDSSVTDLKEQLRGILE